MKKINLLSIAGQFGFKKLLQHMTLTALMASSSGAWAAVAVTKNFVPNTIEQGDVTRMTLTVNNSGGAISNGTLTDNFPSQIVIAPTGANFQFTNCGAANGVVGGGGSSVTISNIDIPASTGGISEVCSIDVDVTSVIPGNHDNTIAAGGFSATEAGIGAVSNASPVTQTLVVSALQALQINKTFAANPILQGQSTTLSITVTNPNAKSVGLTTLAENLPSNIQLTSVPAVACTGTGAVNGAVTASSNTGNSTFNFSGGTRVGANGVCTITATVQGLVASGATAVATNTIPANGVVNDRGIGSNLANRSITVNSPINVTKAFAPTLVRKDQPFTLTITIRNNGASALTVTDFLDNPIADGAGLTITGALSETNCGATPTAPTTQSVRLQNGSIAANTTCTITVPVTASTTGTFNNSIPVDAVANPDNYGSPARSASVLVSDVLRTAKIAYDPVNGSPARTTFSQGSIVRYGVSIQNLTDTPVNNVSFTDNLPQASNGAQITLLNSGSTPGISGAGCSATPTASANGSNSVTFTGINLPQSTNNGPSQCDIWFDVLVPHNWPANQNIINTIPANAVTNGTIGAETTATSNTDAVPRFQITKAFSPASIVQGQTSVLTVTLTNTDRLNDLINASFLDALPTVGGAIVIANPPNASTTCPGGAIFNGTTAGAATLDVQGLTIPKNASCTVSVSVTGNVVGTNTNTIAVNQTSATDSRDNVAIQAEAPANATLTVTPTFTASKSFSPATVAVGGTSRVTIVIENLGTATLNNVTVTDPLPTGMTLASVPSAITTCDGTTTITAIPNAASASLSGVSLPGGKKCQFLFDVVSTTSTPSVNAIPAGNLTAEGGLAYNQVISATLNKLGSQPNLSVTKNFVPNALTYVGQTSRLTITIANTEGTSVALSNVALTDTMPAGMVLTADPAPSTTCSGGVVSAAAGGQSLVLSGASMAANSSCTYSANVTLTRTGSLTNTIAASAVTNNQGITNSLPFSTNLSSVSGVGVQKAFNPIATAPNQPSRMTLTIVNSRAIDLTDLSAVDNLPSGLVVAAPSGVTNTCGGTVTLTSNAVRLTGGALGAANGVNPSSCEINVNLVSAAVGAYTNVIQPGDISANSGGVTNTDPAQATLTVANAVTITKAFSVPSIVVNGISRLTVTLTNPNALALHGAVLTDTLPTGIFVAPTPNTATTCTGGVVTANPSDASARLTGGTIPANGACTFSVDVTGNIPGNYINTIPVAALTTTEGASNTTPASAPITVVVPPTLGKVFVPVQINANGIAKLTINLGNANATPITLTQALVDSLPSAPSQMVLATPVNLAGTCTLGSVTAVAGATTVTYANGAAIPAGGCTITVDVTASITGAYNNQIPSGGLLTNAGRNDLPATATLQVSTRNSIAGKVYRDNDNDGIVDGIEVGIAGQTIQLLDGTGTVIQTTLTDSLGNYSFLDLPDGTYSVRQPNQPTNTLAGKTTVGTGATVNGTASAVITSPSQISGVQLVAGGIGQNAANFNFGEIPPSTIAGHVFLDINNDGQINGTDSGLPNVGLTLTGNDDLGNPVNISLTSNADGTYNFTNLRPSAVGGYTVTEGVQSPGTANGITTAGTINNVSTGLATAPNVLVNAPTQTSRISGIVLPINSSSINNNFGEIASGGAITGKIFVDNNNDGAQAANDIALGGIVVTLTGLDDSNNPVTRQITTNPDGTYAFVGLALGTYQVSYTAPTQDKYLNGRALVGSLGGTSSSFNTLTGIKLTSGTPNASSNNFTRLPAASIAGKVFLDVNNNGLLDNGTADKGLTGISITLTGTDNTNQPVNRTVATDANGNYIFEGLLPGIYKVTEPTQPTGTLNGITKPGTINGQAMGTATTTAIAPSEIKDITLTGTQASIDNNFAEYIGASLNGTVWYDIGTTSRVLDGGDQRLANWIIEVLDPTTKQIIGRATTGTNGSYTVPNLAPGIPYQVQFRDPGSNVVFGKPVNGEQGGEKYPCSANQVLTRSSCLNTDGGSLKVVLQPGDNLIEQSLPVDPSGVVYDSVARTPVPGSVVTLSPLGSCAGYDPNVHLVNASAGGYTISGSAASLTVGSNGFYQFLFSPAAPSSCQFQLAVTPPAGYTSPSTFIPSSGTLNTPSGTGTYSVQPQSGAPAVGQTTTYYLTVNAGSGMQNIIHNHIPIDPAVLPGLTISKTGSVQTVELGDSLVYTIKVRSSSGAPVPNIVVQDTLPAGFKYIKGTARQVINGMANVMVDPVGDVGPALTFSLGNLPQNGELYFIYRVRVGVGAQQGDGINRAQAASGTIRSNVAQYKVLVTGGVFTQDACVIGKIFVDCNNNHVQDQEELGIPGVRFYFEDGTYLISDSEGKYSICGLTPRTHAMKADKTTLPLGSRLTTSSNRNAGDANSLFVDLKNGELFRADFIEGSCSNTVLEQVKARKANGETRAPQTEKKGGNAFKFSSKSVLYPQQGTDSANQPAVKPRYDSPQCGAGIAVSDSQCNVPVPQLQLTPAVPSTQGGAHVN